MLIKSKATIIPPKKQSKTKNKFIKQTHLPIFDYKTDLLKVFEDNQIIIVVGETGSGKTTQMP
jgi:HrpA-like RNA helicase